MDVEISITGLIEEFNALVEAGDFEGAEEVLAAQIGAAPQLEAFWHFQFGQLYTRWNKLSSAVNHLQKAAELAHARGDQLFALQAAQELKRVKDRQMLQRP